MLIALLAVPLTASIASAQAQLELPQPSLKAKTEQRVGVTDFTIDYTSPGVKKRKIWGELVAYDKPWRAGANAATKLTASRDFSFAGTAVKAGTYSVFMIPAKGQWTVILNSDTAASEQSYDAKKDAARVKIAPAALPAVRERLLYVFTDSQDDRTMLDLEWERVRIRMPITVDTKKFVNDSIEAATNGPAQAQLRVAGYYFNSNDFARALVFADKSIAIQSTWRNEWLRAQILQKQGKKADAVAAANRAQNLGKTDKIFEQFVKADVDKAIATWK